MSLTELISSFRKAQRRLRQTCSRLGAKPSQDWGSRVPRFAALAVAAACLALVLPLVLSASSPAPPPVKSGTGYLLVVGDGVSVPPYTQRVFIQPRGILAVFDETDKDYLLLARLGDGDQLCRIPKSAKTQVLMVFEPGSDEVVFRGAIEAATTPIPLRRGEELALLPGGRSGHRLVALVRDGRRFNLAIPEGLPGLRLSKDSVFERFAAEQGKRGLEFVEGAWLPLAEAEKLAAAADAAKRQADARGEVLRAAAARGVVELKDGRILRGVVRGGDGSSILFESDGRGHWLGESDIADTPLERMLARGQLDLVARALERAWQLAPEDPGMAMFAYGEALAVAAKIERDSAPEEFARARKISRLAEEERERIDADLAAVDKIVYQWTALPREDVEWHTARGHILFQRRIWLRPEQVCGVCQGVGKLACPECGAHGWTRDPCKVCGGGGNLPCPICGGIGAKTCPTCAGSGSIGRICRRCNGRGTILRYRYESPYWDYRPRVVISGSTTVVLPAPPYHRGFYHPVYTACPGCGGTGRETRNCPTCGGRGAVSCPKTVKCQACQGVGFTRIPCPRCQGRREITCDKCGGAGYTGEPQIRPVAAPPPAAAAEGGGGMDPTLTR